MPILWYRCKNCGLDFSFVQTCTSDCIHCPFCHSSAIIRLDKTALRKRLSVGAPGRQKNDMS